MVQELLDVHGEPGPVLVDPVELQSSPDKVSDRPDREDVRGSLVVRIADALSFEPLPVGEEEARPWGDLLGDVLREGDDLASLLRDDRVRGLDVHSVPIPPDLHRDLQLPDAGPSGLVP